jgi:hypothetical protein
MVRTRTLNAAGFAEHSIAALNYISTPVPEISDTSKEVTEVRRRLADDAP